MSSKRWTIIWLTLTLLILGCSDSEVAKVKAQGQPGAMGVAAALSNRTTAIANHEPTLPPDAGVAERLEIPPAFQPPLADPSKIAPVPCDVSQILLPVVGTGPAANADEVRLLGFVDALGLKTLLSKANTLKFVRLSDAAGDMQVVAVVAPVVTVQQGTAQIELNLFQLPGFHDPTTVMDVAGKSFGGQAIRGLGPVQDPNVPLGLPGMDGEPKLPPLPGFHAAEVAPAPGRDG
ncbi:MAG: hypothetical protein ABI614_09965 [Planctomycetota bacterium]